VPLLPVYQVWAVHPSKEGTGWLPQDGGSGAPGRGDTLPGSGGGGRQVLRGEVTTCGHTAKSCSLFLILSDWSCDDTLSRILLGADDKR
jgi:hypothetical protein